MMSRKIHILEIRNTNTNEIRHIGIPEEIIAKEDITEFSTLTEKGKTKFGLKEVEKGEFIGVITLFEKEERRR